MKSVLVVCIGNICRSPMAAGLFSRELPGSNVMSAGLDALIGKPADPIALELMAERNIDISSHIARQINRDMCSSADIILVMDSFQKRELEQRYPQARGKVFRLVGDEENGVLDPYKLGRDAFEEALGTIERGTHSWVSRINKIMVKERQFI